MDKGKLQEKLFGLADSAYRDFTAALIPNIDKKRIIGVRSPELRKIAKDFGSQGDIAAFFSALPHEYHEENLVHAMIISNMRDFESTVSALDDFVGYIDNWAVNDTISPRSFKKRPDDVRREAYRWIEQGEEYSVRLGVSLLMGFCLGENYRAGDFEFVAGIGNDEYYVRMMVAWYFATALAKNYEDALRIIEEKRLPKWTQNKAIQKAVESRRISDEQKSYLRTLKCK